MVWSPVASVSKLIHRGVELLHQGRPEQAAALYRDAIARSPKNPDAWHLLAVALFQLGNAQQAAEHAERAVSLDSSPADYWSNLGRYYLSLGRLADAQIALERALSSNRSHPLAHFNLGAALARQGAPSQAVEHLQQYVRLAPLDAGGHHLLGTVLADLLRPAEAAACFRQVIRLNPSLAEGHNNLGNALQSLGQHNDALDCYRKALELRPCYPDAASNYGAALQALGRLEEAEAWYEEALRQQPGLVQARGNQASLLAARRRHAEAVEAYRELLEEIPESVETWNNLGNSLQELGRYEEAYHAFQQALERNPSYWIVHNNIGNALRRQGRYAEALAQYEKVLGYEPNFVDAINNFAVALQDLGRGAEAVPHFERAVALRPGYVDPLINLSNYWRDRGRPQMAIGYLRRASAIRPDNPYLWNNLGCSLSDQGLVEEGISCWWRALELMPENWQAHSNLLLNMHYTGEYSPDAIAAAHRLFAEQHETPLAGARQPHANIPDPDRPLRIGYASADFRRHSVAFFLEPVIEYHHREQFIPFCYSDVARPDPVTARFQAIVGENWRDVRGFNHDDFADLVRRDGIDILIDLAGHTANSRLLSFALKPAPVQMSWLGYPNTTGLGSIDYRITDALADPPGQTEAWHSEKLIRLEGGFLCFRPPSDAPLPAARGAAPGETTNETMVAAPPFERTGKFTFGSFNNMAKMSGPLVELWAEILRSVPESRLALKNRALSEPEARTWVVAQFSRRGIGEGRILMSGLVENLADHLRSYQMIDLALDTFPYHGTTTTCEAMWMGVPVLSLCGASHVSRVGASLLGQVGLDEFRVTRPEDYVRRAIELARDPGPLATLRIALRERMLQSSLTDERGFTSRLERCYRNVWRSWCGD
jgi:predicted O-linked N-acetylglucosamine transferase (SPINDLY family)